MISIAAAGLVMFSIGVAVMIAASVPVTGRRLLNAYLVLGALIILGSVNYELSIFDQKDASEAAFDVYSSGRYFSETPQFALQAMLNAPSFAITGDWWSAIGTNAGLSALVYLAASARGNSSKTMILAPSVVSFSMFALRDPLIGVIFYLFTRVAMQPHSGRRLSQLALLVVAIYLSRPENLLIAGIAIAVIARSRSGRSPVRLLTLPAMVGSGIAALRYGPRLLGLSGGYSLTETPAVFERFFTSRAGRYAIDDGNQSAILGGRLSQLNFLIRYPVQLLSFVVLPLPFEIRTPSMALAFLDSLFLLWVVKNYRANLSKESKLVALVFILCSAFFVSNYGNSFRLRLPLYFILAAGASDVEASPRAATATRSALTR